MGWSPKVQLQVLFVVVITGGAVAGIARSTDDEANVNTWIVQDAATTVTASPEPTSDDATSTTAAAPRSAFADRVPTFPEAPPAKPAPLPAAGGAAPLVHRIPTDDPVAFITIDDGLVQHPQAVELIREAGVPTSLFLISGIARDHRDYFAEILGLGATLQTHTITHDNLAGQSLAHQRHEICGGAEELAASFGTRPTLFRPPGGAYDDTTLQAAADCGMRAVVHWSETVNNGALQYQTPDQQVHAGDIILMHFRHTFVEDFLAALDAIHDAGLTPAQLEDYLP